MNETATTSPTVGAPDSNPAKRTSAARSSTVVTLTRADQLRLGDTFPVKNFLGVWENWEVRQLAFEGEDVLVNGTLSTSPGNCFQVLSAR